MIGRGLRLSPQTGKRDCLILDFVNAFDLFADMASEPSLFNPNADNDPDPENTNDKRQMPSRPQAPAGDLDKELQKYDDLSKIPDARNVRFGEHKLPKVNSEDTPGVTSEPPLFSPGEEYFTSNETPQPFQLHAPARDAQKDAQESDDLSDKPELQPVYVIAIPRHNSRDILGAMSKPTISHSNAQDATDNEAQPSSQTRSAADDVKKVVQKYDDLRKTIEPQSAHVVALLRNNRGNTRRLIFEPSGINRSAQSATDDETRQSPRVRDLRSKRPNPQSVDVVDYGNLFGHLDQHLPFDDRDPSGKRSIRRHNGFNWVKCDEDVYILVAKMGGDTNSYTALYPPPPSSGKPTSFSLVLRLLRHAAWRSSPASEAQKILILDLWKARKEVDESEEDVVDRRYPDLTKGMAADMITRLMHTAWNQVPVETTTEATQTTSSNDATGFRRWSLFRWLWKHLRFR